MDASVFHTVAWVGLGWLGLATLVTAGLAVFLKGAHARERTIPTDEIGIRTWVRGEPARQLRRRARPPAA